MKHQRPVYHTLIFPIFFLYTPYVGHLTPLDVGTVIPNVESTSDPGKVLML